MSVRRIAQTQPDSFAFTAESEAKVQFWLAKYPHDRRASAVIPLLWIVQKQENWVPEAAMRQIAERLGMAYIRVLEVATFYTMYNLGPTAKHLIQVCGTTPCWLRGADDLKAVCEAKIGAKGRHHVTTDGMLAWEEVECLGACANAPMVQISNTDGDEYYEDLTAEALESMLDDLVAGKAVKSGPVSGRHCSEPFQAKHEVLTDASLYDGSRAKAVKLPNAEGVEPQKPAAAKPAPAAKPALKTLVDKKTPPPATEEVSGKEPQLLKGPDGAADDLKVISGVGPKLEGLLNDLGIYHYRQIAAWGADEIAWVDARLKFKGRIERDDWIGKAKALIGDSDGQEPDLLSAPDGQADDLKKISGVGPKLEALLNDLGIFHYRQIAKWNADHVAWVDARLKFKGRIERDNWIEKAKQLAKEAEG